MQIDGTNGLRNWAALAGALVLSGCAHLGGEPRASTWLTATQGNSAHGVVTFQQQGVSEVVMTASVHGLKPNQEHGFHLHERGDCSSSDGTSAAGHFNPGGHAHGPRDAEHHAGDLPALKADATGHAEMRVVLQGLTVSQGPTSVVGRGLIVHISPDDFTTQPTGNSGARIACGVVALDFPAKN